MADVAESSHGGASTRACQNCSRAKAKCVPQPPGSTDSRCTRCSRLNKECLVLPRATRKRRSPNSATNTAKLEQKIESLVTLIANAQGVNINLDQLTPPASHSHSEASPKPVSVDAPPLANTSLSWAPAFSGQAAVKPWGASTSLDGGLYPGPAALPFQDSTASQTSFSSKIWQLSDQEGDRLLTQFRQHFLPHFPFILIPSNSSSAELRIQKPHVLKAMWTIAFQKCRIHQLEMSKDIMVDISTAMLVRGARDLDMLEALILLNSWSYLISLVPPSYKSTGLYQLTLGLLFDLKLTKPIRECDNPDHMLADCHPRSFPESFINDTAKRSSDDCRALLCCFYIGSVHSISSKRTEDLQYTPYIEYCCQTLEARAERESDLLLVSLVKLECLTCPIDELLTKKTSTGGHRAPITMHILSIRESLEQFWKSLPLNIKQHPLMILSYNGNCVFLYESSLYKELFPSTSFVNSNLQRLDLLHDCVLVCKKLFDEFLERQTSTFYGISNGDLAPLGRGFNVLLKLCFVEEPGWDLSLVRQSSNLTFYFQELITRFQQVGTELDEIQPTQSKHSFFTGCARAMRLVKTWYETKVRSEPKQNSMQDQAAAVVEFDGIMNWEYLDFMNDSWSEFMGVTTTQ